ncbi:MAG: hypothetical protein WDN24_13535 [Sphingomonas sp.]
MTRHLAALALLLACFAAAAPAHADCRKVGDVDSKSGKPAFLKIDAGEAAKLAQIGVDRALIFASMVDTSVPETGGCWAAPAGNFDGQVISVGMSQWNFGTGSLQPLLKSWKARFATNAAFVNARTVLAPVYGELIFSDGCLKVPATVKCQTDLLAAQDATGKLDPVLSGELTAVFETDLMLQVMTDAYVKLLSSVADDLHRVFPNGPITPRKIKWAIDTKVQQGGFPADEDISRLRAKLAALQPADRPARLKAVVAWYKALGDSVDQDGIKWDIGWNAQRWNCLIDAGAVDDEEYELLNLSYLRSRVASGNSGRWQALTFQRRAKIILGVGSIGGAHTGNCPAPATP